MVTSRFTLLSALLLWTGFAAPGLAEPVRPARSEARVLDPEFDFRAMAESYLERNGLQQAGLEFRDVVSGEGFVQVILGAFDVRFPVTALGDEAYAKRFIASAHTLVEIQVAWFAWRGTSGNHKEVAADWKTLGRWVKSWSARKLAKCKGGQESLYEQLGAKDAVKEAAARLIEFTSYPEEVAELMGDRNLTVLAPNRETFLECAALVGLLDEKKRGVAWKDLSVRMAAGWSDWDQYIALENAGHPVDYKHPFDGRDLETYDKKGLRQHVADRGSVILLRKEFWRHGTHFFEESLATNLVIEAIGQNAVSSQEFEYSYSRAGASTQPYERFVPGGNPGGGTLPARKAIAGPTRFSGSFSESAFYREGLGVEYFHDSLVGGQKDGSKLASKDKDNLLRKDKRPHFKLYSLETHTSTYISAPFLGIPAEGKNLPGDEFLDEYEDLFRAYRSGFIEWLRLHGAGSKKASKESFAALVQGHAQRKDGVALDEIAQRIYGVPLSGKDDSDDNLEWRFLGWLKKGK